MIRDDDATSRQSFALDVQLFCDVPDKWKTSHGGFISYIAESENEEVSIINSNNTQLVYYILIL